MKKLPSFFPLCFAFLFFAFSMWNSRAEDISSAFNQGNQLYEQQKYSEAAAVYEKTIQSGQISTALYFNLGNARFKAGQLGRAIIAYRQAEKLSPRDPDIRANLYFARTEAHGGNPPRSSLRNRLLNKLSLNEWTLAVLTCSTLFFLLLALGQWKPAAKKSLRTFTLVSGVCLLFCGVSLGLVAQKQLFSKSSVVIVPEAVVRRGPFEESQSVFTLRDGAELSVLDQKNTWLQITDSQNRIGWLPQSQVVVLKSPFTAPVQKSGSINNSIQKFVQSRHGNHSSENITLHFPLRMITEDDLRRAVVSGDLSDLQIQDFPGSQSFSSPSNEKEITDWLSELAKTPRSRLILNDSDCQTIAKLLQHAYVKINRPPVIRGREFSNAKIVKIETRDERDSFDDYILIKRAGLEWEVVRHSHSEGY